MFDINAIINNAIATAVAEAIKPLVERIEKLESDAFTMRDHIDRMREIAAEEVQRIAPEDNPATGTDYELVRSYVLDDPQLHNLVREIANEVAESTLSEHTEEYDHDDYDSVVRQVEDLDFDGLATEDSIRENIEDVLNNCTLSIRL